MTRYYVDRNGRFWISRHDTTVERIEAWLTLPQSLATATARYGLVELEG